MSLFHTKNQNGEIPSSEADHTCKCNVEEQARLGTLADVESGKKVQICCLSGEQRLVRRLSEMGFIPGTSVEVLRRAPFHDPIEFELRGYLVSLRRAEAECIRVKAVQLNASNLSTDSI